MAGFFGLFSVLIFAKAVFAASALYPICEPGTSCAFGEFIFADDGYTPIATDGFCQFTVTDPTDAVLVNGDNMSHKSDGWYYYNFSAPALEGVYRSKICCDTGSNRRCLDKTFVVGTSLAGLPAKIWSYSSRTLTSLGALAADIWNNAFAPNRTLTSRQIGADEYLAGVSTSTVVNQVASAAQAENLQTELDAVKSETDLIYGDTQSISSETDVLAAKWGSSSAADIINGLNSVQAKVGASTDATSSATIFGRIKYLQGSLPPSQSALLQEVYDLASSTLTAASETQAELGYHGTSTTAYADLRLVKSAINALAGNVGSPADSTSTDSLFGRIKQVRTSQQKVWTVYLSNVQQVLAGNTYRAKIWILNNESVPTDPYNVPLITLDDASRNIVAQNVAATRISAGIYEYTYNVAGTAMQGNWETQATTQVEPGKTIETSGYWEVQGSPAQVKINSITDNTVPSISANVIFTNEGLAGYEYQYEWCVVANQNNPCGGGDDTFYSSAAKYLDAGQNWTTDLSGTVPSGGTYYFKVVVYYGTEKSGASQVFSAIVPGASCGDGICGSGENCNNCSADCGYCAGGGGGGGSIATVPAPATNVPPAVTSTENSNLFADIWTAIKGILARLTGLETRADTLTAGISSLEDKFSDLNNRVVSLLKPAPPQIIQRQVIVRKPIATVPTPRAKVRLEVR